MTSRSDNFDGGTPQLTWSTIAGGGPTYANNEIESNALIEKRCDDALSTADHKASLKFLAESGPGGYMGPLVRVHASAQTYYGSAIDFTVDNDPTMFVVKFVAGSPTVLETVANSTNANIGNDAAWLGSAGGAHASGRLIELSVTNESGNARLVTKVNGVQVSSYLDNSSPITANVRCGYVLGGDATNYLIADDFAASDVSGGVARDMAAKVPTSSSARAALGKTKSFAAKVPVAMRSKLRRIAPVIPGQRAMQAKVGTAHKSKASAAVKRARVGKVATSVSAKATLATSSGSGGGGSDQLVGRAAYKMLGWGGPGWWFRSAAEFASLHAQGWGGMSVGIQHMGPLGGDYYFKGTTAAGDPGFPGSAYFYQRVIEGLQVDNSFRTPVAFATANSMSSGIGFYTKQAGQNTDIPPLGGDWTNTTNRTNIANFLAGVAGFMNLVGMDELHFDTELNGNGWNIGAPTATRQGVFDFGKALGQAVYAVKPSADTAVYSWYSTDGWDGEVISYTYGFGTNYGVNNVQDDFWCGWMEGMRLSGGTGFLYCLNAKYYRPPSAYMPASYESAYKLDIERALAQLSRLAKPGHAESRPWASDALWSFIASHYRVGAFTWRGHDGYSFYVNTQPDDATWSVMAAKARLLAMGPKRWEYTYAGTPYDESWYSNSGFITGAQTAASSTPISTTYPSITNLAKVANGGGSYTITCRASHLYGVTHVAVFLGATLLSTMRMTWNANGGSTATNYNNSYQDCTATISGRTPGDVITVVAYSAKDDVKASNITL